MTIMGKAERDAIDKRCEAAMKGPWYVETGYDWWDIKDSLDNTVVSCGMEGDVTLAIEDAQFIAHARTDVPALRDTVDALAERVQGLFLQVLNIWPKTETIRREIAATDKLMAEYDGSGADAEEGVKS